MKNFFRPAVFILVASHAWVAQAQSANVALVRHAPAINGLVGGSLQVLTGENVTLPGGGTITGDLFVPGSPTVRLNGPSITFGGVQTGSGSSSPADYVVTLNNQASLGRLRTRTDPVNLPAVATPPAPAGTRRVTLNQPGETAGDFATVRDVTLVGRVGQVAVPPGVYGDFSASSGSAFLLGVAGANTPAAYAFQQLRIGSGSELRLAGPVVITVAAGMATNGLLGTAAHPEWLKIQFSSGGLSVNGNAAVYGTVIAPTGAVTLTGQTQLFGSVVCDQLSVLAGAGLRVVAQQANQPPTVALTSPANGASFVAPATVVLAASAADADGTVTKVEFFQGGIPLGTSTASPYQFTAAGLLAGNYTFTARATDNGGATADSAPVNIAVASLNVPPTVTLTAPPDGGVFNFPASIQLGATASDPDGTVVRVEFYAGANKLGESLAVPFTFTWTGMLPGSYRLSARAFDDQGASAPSNETRVSVRVALPYYTDFEATEGYVAGALDEQAEWSVSGSASVTTSEHFSGASAVELSPMTPATRISHAFPADLAPPIVFVDLFVKMVAAPDAAQASILQGEGARVALVRAGTQAEITVFDGNGSGGGAWRGTGIKVDVGANGQSDWLRLTLREDFAAGKWDLFANGRLAAYDLGLTSATQTRFSMFALTGAAPAATALDALLISFDNPLFADADHDGMDDAWEVANGLNPASDDRRGDLDGDGLSNLREFQLGTAANKRDTDDDGMPDGWEIQYGLNPRTNDANGDLVGDGVSNLTKYLQGRDPTKPALPDTTGLIHLKIFQPR